MRPPSALQPLVACRARMFAHSLRLLLPMMIAPAARSRATTPRETYPAIRATITALGSEGTFGSVSTTHSMLLRYAAISDCGVG